MAFSLGFHIHFVSLRCDVIGERLKVKLDAIRSCGEWGEMVVNCGSVAKTDIEIPFRIFLYHQIAYYYAFVRSFVLLIPWECNCKEATTQTEHQAQNPWNIGRDRKANDFLIMWPRHVLNSNYYYHRDVYIYFMLFYVHVNVTKAMVLMSTWEQNG